MKKLAIILALALTLGVSACSNDEGSNARKEEQVAAQQQLDGFLKSQPVPSFPRSQLRQNLIEIEAAQAETTATTSFFFNVGVPDPLSMCSSIGFAIPATYQLTNPEQIVNGRDGRVSTIPQLESNGVYTGDTSGTYVICIDGNGSPYAFYHEGYVSTVTGPAKWDYDKHQIVLTGAPTGDFSVLNNG